MAEKPKIGLALGSGAARGWSQIGIIRKLKALGIEPDVITGTSIGSIVGAMHCLNVLDQFEQWVLKLNTKEIIKYFDVSIFDRGGLINGDKLKTHFLDQFGPVNIEDLPLPFACVATDIYNGREEVFKQGSLVDAIRASISLPGLFKPHFYQDRWYVDGGLVNPVPVSTAYALGADIVIAVNLNQRIVGKQFRGKNGNGSKSGFAEALQKAYNKLEQNNLDLNGLLPKFAQRNQAPGLFPVISSTISIMQDRITRSRLAAETPEVILSPRTEHIELMEFDRAAETILEGEKCVERNQTLLEDMLDLAATHHGRN